jgi:hypothetical protein
MSPRFFSRLEGPLRAMRASAGSILGGAEKPKTGRSKRRARTTLTTLKTPRNRFLSNFLIIFFSGIGTNN